MNLIDMHISLYQPSPGVFTAQVNLQCRPLPGTTSVLPSALKSFRENVETWQDYPFAPMHSDFACVLIR